MNPLHKAALALEEASSHVQDKTTGSTAPEPVGQLPRRHTRKKSATRSRKHSRTVSPTAAPDLKQNRPDPVKLLPSPLARKLTGLPKDQHALLLAKQQKLLALNALASAPSPVLATATAATLIFAQEAGGTAICIAPTGRILTCSHCISENAAGPYEDSTPWLISASGRIVQTRCIAFDGTRDLALLQVIGAQSAPSGPDTPDVENSFPFPFPCIALSPAPPKPRQRIACIGHPGSEDLEDPLGGATGHPILSLSRGRFRGLARGQDVQDNSEIGALQHDCWTYWGHSGAALVDEKSERVVGVHSSWAEGTGMRRGVAWEAVRGFLDEWSRGGEKNRE